MSEDVHGMRLISCSLCREESERLWNTMDRGNQQQALELLRASQHAKEVAYIKHQHSGALPIHAALEKEMFDVARELANSERYPGVLQQTDSQGYESASCAPCCAKLFY
jgi:hypothetical protein